MIDSFDTRKLSFRSSELSSFRAFELSFSLRTGSSFRNVKRRVELTRNMSEFKASEVKQRVEKLFDETKDVERKMYFEMT